MSRFLPFVFLLLLGLSAKGQSSVQVTSTDGYVVNIELEAVGIDVSTPCPNGYNYNVIVDYNISFTGNNIPGAGVWTLQSTVGCGSNSLYLPLPNQGGTGNVVTGANVFEPDCNLAPTIENLLCDEFIIEIEGPGIPSQQISLSPVLPVNFTAFTATPKGKQVQLDWGTSNESRNDFFEVQRSHDAISWSTISRIDGSGSTEQVSTYRFMDVDTRAGDVYYRLRQVDFDGAAVFSHTVSLSLGQGNFGAFPNPTNGPLTIEGSGSITVRDLTGRTLLTTVGLSGNETATLDLSSLRPGLYLVQTEAGVQKIMRN